MSKILIATTNNSKFEVVKELLISCGFENYNFKLLKDLDLIIEDKKENGNIFERAKDKAVNVYNTINNSKYNNDFEYIIGIDDGIEIKNIINPNVKTLISPIINNELLKDSEIVYICRAFYFYKNNTNQKGIITKIPFKYKQWTKDIDFLKEHSYPLSYVLCPLNSNLPVIEMDKKVSNDYNLSYCKKELKSIKKELDII